MKRELSTQVKKLFLRTKEMLSSDERAAYEVRRIREKYDQYGTVKIQDILLAYKAQLKQFQLIFTGVMLVMFTALLGGFGKAIFRWISRLLILNAGKSLKNADKFSVADQKVFLGYEGIFIGLMIIMLVLGIKYFIDKIKDKQLKVFILEDLIKRRSKHE